MTMVSLSIKANQVIHTPASSSHCAAMIEAREVTQDQIQGQLAPNLCIRDRC